MQPWEKFSWLLCGHEIGIWPVCGMCVRVPEQTSKRVRGHSLWPTLALPSPFLTQAGVPSSQSRESWVLGSSGSTPSRWEDCAGIPSASGCGAGGEARWGERQYFLCVDGS